MEAYTKLKETNFSGEFRQPFEIDSISDVKRRNTKDGL